MLLHGQLTTQKNLYFITIFLEHIKEKTHDI